MRRSRFTYCLLAIGAVIFIATVAAIAWKAIPAKAEVALYSAPNNLASSGDYKVTVDGKPLFTYKNYVSNFVNFSFDGKPVTIRVESKTAINSLDIRPKSLGIEPKFTAGSKTATFTLASYANLSIEINGTITNPLFVFANPLEQNTPKQGDPNVMHYGPGIHTVTGTGEIIVPQGKTVYLDGGAIVKGKFRVGPSSATGTASKDVKILGRGIVDSSGLENPGRPLRIQKSSNVLVDGPIFLGRETWGVVAYSSDKVTLKNIKVINWRETSSGTPDGIDIVGSSNVLIDGGFVRSYDDGVAIKNAKNGWDGTVENVDVKNMTIFNADAGNALEIGWETTNAFVRGIKYSNIDIIHKRSRPTDTNNRAALAIHSVGAATISNVIYDGIRIEDAQENYINFRIFSDSTGTGKIDGVYAKNVSVTGGAKDLPIIIAGLDAANPVRNVTFENLRLFDKVISAQDQARVNPGLDASLVQKLTFISTSGTVPTPQAGTFGAGVLFKFLDPAIVESSGLAVADNLFWTHNDNTSDIYAVNRSGTTLARFKIPNLPSSSGDWEDIAAGTDEQGRPSLYMGDIGDNSAKRTEIAVVRVTRPGVDTTQNNVQSSTSNTVRYRFKYPDGTKDAESLLVQPGTNRIYIISKAAGGAMYQAPATLSTTEVNTLTKIGTVTIPGATGASFSSDGKKFVVRQYRNGALYSITNDDVAAAIKTKPIAFDIPAQKQGEAIDFAANDTALVMTSEGQFAPVIAIATPGTPANPTTPSTPTPVPAPTGSSTPSPTPAPTPSAPAVPVTLPTSPSPTPVATPITLQANADAYVRGNNTQSGTSSELTIKNTPDQNYNRVSYLKFNMEELGLTKVSKATVRLYLKGTEAPGTKIPISLYRTTDSWTESGISWGARPALGELLGTITVSSNQQYYEWDVTAFVNSELAPSANKQVTFAFTDDSKKNVLATFNSREASSNQPQLILKP